MPRLLPDVALAAAQRSHRSRGSGKPSYTNQNNAAALRLLARVLVTGGEVGERRQRVGRRQLVGVVAELRVAEHVQHLALLEHSKLGGS